MAGKAKSFIAVLLSIIILYTFCSCRKNTYTSSKLQPQRLVAKNIASNEKEAETSPLSVINKSVSLSDIPEYSGVPFVEINNNVPFFTPDEVVTDTFEKYAPLDSEGRCGVAYANICRELMPTEKRGSIGMIKPSGWHTVRYDFIDGEYLYNRCHLIAYQLAGENANEQNLITGTRFLNNETMLKFEGKVYDYIMATNNHVLYRVTPFFDGENLLASGILMEGFSVEDNGKGICYNVFCYNVQPGVVIDYSNGESYAEEQSSESLFVEESITTFINADNNFNEVQYIGNKNTKKFHYPNCSGVADMNEKNKVPLNCTRTEAIALGYLPCGICNP